jgi:hypothetical protein
MTHQVFTHLDFQTKEVVITFEDPDASGKVRAFLEKKPNCPVKAEGHEIHLPCQEGLEIIRAGEHHIVFVLTDESAAITWSQDLILGESAGREVWIKRNWDESQLLSKLGLLKPTDDILGISDESSSDLTSGSTKSEYEQTRRHRVQGASGSHAPRGSHAQWGSRRSPRRNGLFGGFGRSVKNWIEG